MKEFIEEYKELQKNISQVERGLELREGHEWALKEDSFTYLPEHFWVKKVHKDELHYVVPDGGGHCKEHKMDAKLLNHTPEERDAWLEESVRICEEKMEANTIKWENRMLDTRLDLIKRSVVEKHEGYVEYATKILEEILNSH